ncbi:MAG: type II toxin-antitoxin system RelE/ParE family toxin [Candidatus Thermoplasmatota archaeon]|nr:type II toxin-antitoxin system RelE/ParE family toxin [Candidatus Thermoplasmatota archaeon]
MTYQLLIEERAVEELKSVSDDIRNRIKSKIKDILKDDPLPDGKGDIKRIKGTDYWRLRVGDYRVFYDVDKGEKKVYIISVRHRSNAYKEL